MKFEKLGNIADIIAGQSPPSSTYNSEGNGIPFFQGKADYGEKYPTVRYWCTEPTKISLPEDILISMRAPVGPVNINTVESCIGRGLSAIRVKKNVSRDLIYFWLKQNQHIIAAKETGSTFKAITQKILKEIVVPFPSYPDQLHIANILSKAESLIAQRKESIRLLDEFLKSTFLEMFGDPVRNERGWEIFALSDVCTKITDGTHDTPERLTQGVKYITGKHITPFNIDFDNSDYVTENVHKEIFRRTNVEFDDILYTNIGANVGTAARVKVKYEFSLKNVALLKQDRAKLKSHYLEHILNLSNFKQRLLSLLSIGGAQKFLNLKSIGKIKIPLPPIELQAQFAQIVEKTEALKTQYQQSLQELENLYGSLSQRAFKGELTLKQNHVHP